MTLVKFRILFHLVQAKKQCNLVVVVIIVTSPTLGAHATHNFRPLSKTNHSMKIIKVALNFP